MTRVLIDCDPGIDDALALWLAAASPELQIVAVSTVAGNRPVDITARNARCLLDLADRVTLPVYAGAARPIASAQPRCNLVHGEDGLGGTAITQRGTIDPEFAGDAIVRHLLDEPPDSLTVVALGPLTNLALAELRHPGVLRRAASLRIMGGAAWVPGNVTPHAEFNVWADPVAAHIVLGAGCASVHLFPLDVTSQAVMTARWVDELADGGGRCAAAAVTMLQSYMREDALLHDACPVAHLIDASLFEGQRTLVRTSWHPGPEEGRLLAERCLEGSAPATASQPHDGVATVYTAVRPAPLLDLVRDRLRRLALTSEPARGPCRWRSRACDQSLRADNPGRHDAPPRTASAATRHVDANALAFGMCREGARHLDERTRTVHAHLFATRM